MDWKRFLEMVLWAFIVIFTTRFFTSREIHQEMKQPIIYSQVYILPAGEDTEPIEIEPFEVPSIQTAPPIEEIVDVKPQPKKENKFEIRQLKVTAYCPCKICCDKCADGFVANGKRAIYPMIAAPKEYKFGTKMSVPGYNKGLPVKVTDRGGAITGNHIDILFNTHEEAKQWGVKNLSVKIYKEEK